MGSFMDKQSIITGIVLILALAGCEQSHTQPSTVPKYATQTPMVLRAIPIANLSVQVSIDNTTKTFQGTDFPDGQWLIDFDLQPNQTYDINIKWFAQTHLVLEEVGQIFADPEQLTITPELAFISAGYDRFDDDCDGQSNLDEIINGTDPSVAEATAQSACTDDLKDVVLGENVYPWIIRQHKLFRSEGISRVTSYEQPIQITSSNPNIASNFGMSLHTEPDTGIDILARVDFRINSSQGKEIRFEISVASDFQLSPEATEQCVVYRDTGIECTLPYDWQEQQWYNVSIEAVSETSWKAVVRDDVSGASQAIATIETQSNIVWYRAQNVLSYRLEIPSEQCRLGLEPISMLYKHAVANDVVMSGTQQVVSSPCVKAGGGWSEGIRTIDDELVYSLTLGRS